jgi:hypothetical protein
MVQVICDSCKKVVPGAVLNATYYIHQGLDLCTPCYYKMQDTVEKIMAGQKKYSLRFYHQAVNGTVQKMCRR